RGQVVNLADLVRSELERAGRAHPERPMVADLPDEALVRGDEPLLARATADLVDNAVRHGGAGPIAARLALGADELVLRLTNEGPSIPPSHRERVFQPFGRAPNGDAAGFGLGLPFARAVARAHGGDVTLGERDDGTEVVVRLPLARAV